MEKIMKLCSWLFVLLNLVVLKAEAIFGENREEFSRNNFPPNFIFGSGTSAYQVEGAALEDGRTPSIWDVFAHGKYGDKGNVDMGSDQYHKYKEDVQLMVNTGLDAYRFSISWSRLIPNGKGGVNEIGLQYYNNLINELIKHGIQPHVTLFHYDLPQALEEEYGGWLSQKIVDDFTEYADVCFKEFGDRVSYWTTLNEPNVFVLGGYDIGSLPPQRCSSSFGINCTGGNSTSEPYIVAHNILLAHASAAELYKKKYKAKQNGFIGLNVFSYWFLPLTNSSQDLIATQRTLDFYVGWFMNPLVFGDYPETMKKNVGSRIPSFTRLQSKIVKGSFDFIGVNQYNTLYVKDDPNSLKFDQRDFSGDMAAKLIFKRNNDVPTGEFPIDSFGMQGLLEYFKQSYGNPPIYIHENGQQTFHNSSLNDTSRVKYLESYIGSLLNAIRNGSDARGYFSWSFMDVFELLDGFESSFGLYYVDFKDFKRYPKLSAHWYSNFLKGVSNIHASEIAQVEINFTLLPHISYSSQ